MKKYLIILAVLLIGCQKAEDLQPQFDNRTYLEKYPLWTNLTFEATNDSKWIIDIELYEKSGRINFYRPNLPDRIYEFKVFTLKEKEKIVQMGSTTAFYEFTYNIIGTQYIELWKDGTIYIKLKINQ